MISFEEVSFTYAGAGRPTLLDINLRVGEGELVLVTGPTGSGKSTLLGAVNGLVPYATGGEFGGTVVVAGRTTREHRPSDLAEVVGYVGQDPARGFVTASVQEELAYGMEQRGVPRSAMRARIEEVFDLLGVAGLRDAPLNQLSGGQQQRIAIGSALTSGPRILVLDEPTSALDPGAAEDVLALLTRLVHDFGMTVVVAEHRIERVINYADRILYLSADCGFVDGTAQAVMATSDLVPPIVELGRLAGWRPLPLSVREARRAAETLKPGLGSPDPRAAPPGPSRTSSHSLRVTYGPVVAIRDLRLDIHAGQVLVLMGRNGSGKSSLLWALEGSGPHTGEVRRDGRPALVPQTPGDLLYLPTVAQECAQADRDAAAAQGRCAGLLAAILPGVPMAQHPADLSEGQRLALVLAIQLTSEPDIVLVDEPTRGLDYPTKRRLAQVLADLAADGAAVVVATHDVEFAAVVADRIVVLADGEVITDGPARDVLAATPLLQPQVSKVLAPEPWLTVDEVAEALAGVQ